MVFQCYSAASVTKTFTLKAIQTNHRSNSSLNLIGSNEVGEVSPVMDYLRFRQSNTPPPGSLLERHPLQNEQEVSRTIISNCFPKQRLKGVWGEWMYISKFS
jgi:hypothetical protein